MNQRQIIIHTGSKGAELINNLIRETSFNQMVDSSLQIGVLKLYWAVKLKEMYTSPDLETRTLAMNLLKVKTK